LWFVVPHVRTADQFDRWLRSVELLPAESRAKLLDPRHGPLGCSVFTNLIIEAEARKPANEQNWDEVTGRLEQIFARAGAINADLLQGAALRGLVRVQVEFQKRLDYALETAGRGDALALPAARYLVSSEMGRQATITERYTEARAWLDRALADEPADFPSDPFFVRCAASAAFGQVDATAGVDHAAHGVRIVEETPEFSPVDRAAAVSMHAYAVYLRDGVEAAEQSELPIH
jgi:hypothetical protein